MLFSVFANSQVERNMALKDDISRWLDIYMIASQAPEEMVKVMAVDVDRTFADNGQLIFAPSNELMESSSMTFSVDPDRQRTEMLTLAIADRANLSRRDLEDMWGPATRGITAPSKQTPSVWFQYFVKPEYRYEARIIAYLRGKGDDPAAAVKEIRIIREPIRPSKAKTDQ